MQRPLAILAGASCGLFVLCIIANVVAIRAPTRWVPPTVSGPQKVALELAPSASRDQSVSATPEAAAILERADTLAAEHVDQELERVASLEAADIATRSSFVLESRARGLWVTRTEVRIPCRALDRALAELDGSARAATHACERWVEASAAVLERYGITAPTPREFIEEYAGDREMRILVVYAGWKQSPSGVELVHARTAPVYPRVRFGAAKRTARDDVYAQLQLGPYHSEP